MIDYSQYRKINNIEYKLYKYLVLESFTPEIDSIDIFFQHDDVDAFKVL